MIKIKGFRDMNYSFMYIFFCIVYPGENNIYTLEKHD